MGSLTTLEEFLGEHPSIKTVAPSDASFDSIRETYVVTSSVPSLIVRPQSEDDVAALISHCAATSTPFVIRTGGHDLASRSTIDGVLQIDLRDIKHVRVSDDRKTARLGGGVLLAPLLEALEKEGLMTPTGTVGSVGYVGWATFGGYGPFVPSLGLGCDQIVGARIVLASGEVVDADEELLRGVRGAGPALGVIVEIEIKVYPKQEILAGIVAYDSKDLRATIRAFWPSWNKLVTSKTLPDDISLQPSILDVPHMGKVFAVGFVWAGPASEASESWLEEIASLVPGPMKLVAPTSPAGYIAQITSMVPQGVYRGSSHGVNFRGLGLSAGAQEVFVETGSMIPGDGTLISMHQLRGKAARGDHLPGVFRNREDHLMLEVIGLVATKEKAKEGKEWADAVKNGMKGVEGVMEVGYYSLLPKGEVGMEVMYGESWEFIKALKEKVDPGNLFRFAFAG
ncbi:d-lactate dehydrogenase [Colletotrichum musicola]|uniref:D-lactate dehydrogenase n=1 Tax=Colletotrichum musicola TaxID=2175873 RepID=A0A8H6K4Z6_9PEZI|nr:d-lactate dehydrogenase [Colletotrichum musicola]